jgi:hypothetical protein
LFEKKDKNTSVRHKINVINSDQRMSSSYEEHVVGGARSLLSPIHSMAGKSTLKDIKTNSDLDSHFHKLIITIQSHMQVLQRQTQVRITKWLKKLTEETTNTVWKRNRNSYARLLHEQLRSGGKLRAPFDTLPPDGPLPTLSKHTLYPYQATTTTITTTPLNNNNKINNTPSSIQSSATSKLDHYLGRHPTITSDHHDAPERQKNSNNNNNTKSNTNTKKLEMYDTYTNTGLHTQLGASWERQQELEWKLKTAEDVINRQAASLYIDHSKTRHTGSTNGSTNDITPMNGRNYNYYVDTLGGGLELTPVTSGGIHRHSNNSRQRYTSAQLEELLTECEVTRRLRHNHNHYSSSRSGSGNEKKSSSNKIIDDDGIVSRVERFKQGTESIRHRLDKIDGGVKPSSTTTTTGTPGTTIMSKNNKSSKVVIGTEVRHTLKSAAALKLRRAAIIQAGGEGIILPSSLQVDDNSSKVKPLSSSAIDNCHHKHNHNASTITADNVPGYSSELMSELVDLRRRVQHSISAVASPLCTTMTHDDDDDDDDDGKYSLSSLLSDDGSKSGGVSGESSPLCDGDSGGLGVSLNMMLDDDV